MAHALLAQLLLHVLEKIVEGIPIFRNVLHFVAGPLDQWPPHMVKKDIDRIGYAVIAAFRGEDLRDHRERQHRRLGTRAGRIEVLLGMAQSSSQHSGTQDQQHVSNDGTGYQRFHRIVKPGTQGDECDDQFGGVAERCIKKPANPSPMRSASCSVARPIQPASGKMARAEVAKTRKYRSGASTSTPTATGTKSRSQFNTADQSPLPGATLSSQSTQSTV